MFEFIRDYIFAFMDGVVACFTANLSWQYLSTTFWFLIFIEFPRYYLLDLYVVIHQGLTWRKRRAINAVARRQLFTERPLVSILVPGKNEGKHIYALVKSLKEQTYNHYEIVIVDDGSNDATPLICKDLVRKGFITKYFRLFERGGKASAANYGAAHCDGKYIIHLDADSSLDRDAIEKVLIPFYIDPKVKGVGGCVKVRNHNDSLCTCMQALEYCKTIQMGRMGTDLLGIYHIISGAFGAFDAQALRDVGYWDIGPGLDGDITQKLRKAGYKVRFAYDAICMTSVPVKWYALFKQRKRWSKSLVRFRIRKHRDIIWSNRNFRFLNAISNLENIVFDFLFNYVWVFYLVTLVFAATERLFEIFVVAWIIRMSFSVMSFFCMQAITERPKEERYLGAYLIFHTFYTGYFMRICRLIGHTEELLFRTSYKDPWNPAKTSQVAQAEGL